MGVPALYRSLSRKYPKIVLPVVEDFPVSIPGPGGTTDEIPVDTSQPNPNGEEFDNLYLDMNGIVHPCTHPEGKPAPKTEEDMMKEIFLYTERVVAMIRPRKLLMMAIDGVAPRAKMNQQRSRRFRSSQEAKTKEEERIAAIKEWEAMGKEVSDEFKNEKGWDQNAITPGTPFMTLLAESLRYWVAKKLNEDPGWAGLQVIISDASVPGEGEHKIMDFIRRQRSHASHDPNTKHVIYGLDADLIMLALATHEPHFKVLREDVFAQDKKKGCHTCGQPGHHSAQCTGKPKEKMGVADVIQKPAELKPFIFLDVAILREYLTVELSTASHSFPFDLERAMDDWIFLIFFVGNDFLPHLPSLEIREGAIDVLMGIWKSNLERMGGYLTDNGKVNLGRAKVILEGLAGREDEIFRKRREAEERQDRNDKRRKIENDARASHNNSPAPGPSASKGGFIQNGHDYNPVRPLPPPRPSTPAVTSTSTSTGSGLPSKPNWIAEPTADEKKNSTGGATTNGDPSAIKQNLSAAELLKKQLAAEDDEDVIEEGKDMVTEGGEAVLAGIEKVVKAVPELDSTSVLEETLESVAATPIVETTPVLPPQDEVMTSGEDIATATTVASDESMADADTSISSETRGIKRKAEDLETEEPSEEEDAVDKFLYDSILPITAKGMPAPLKLLGNNMVEQEDTVKLWEPGYKERYYRQKFGVELSDLEFRKSLVKSYVEGLCWVLEYYFQGTPSWQWYYPHHFSPFASDFVDVIGDLDIQFELGAPFRPYEQLMGVFPAGSRTHIPKPFQSLMTDPDSPIIDFYPEEFSIDMNGKKMLWQGVALLPFIDPARLLEAMGTRYPQLTEAEVERNTKGEDVLFVGAEHPLYDYLEGLYTKRKVIEPVELDTKRSKGVAGYVLPSATCVPGTTFDSPLPSLPDINGDRSISAFYRFPIQKTPHRSFLLPGVVRERPVLTSHDKDTLRRGGNGGGGYGGGHGAESSGFHAQRQRDNPSPGFIKSDRGRGQRQSYPPPPSNGGHMGGGGYNGGGRGGDRCDLPPQQQQHSGRDPYNGYDSRDRGGPPVGYVGYAAPPQSQYGAPPPQGQYGAPAAYGFSQSTYRPPGGAYQQQQPPQGRAPYLPPPSSYGAPRPPAPPSYQGYGGYGGNGGQQQGGQQQGGNQGGRRY